MEKPTSNAGASVAPPDQAGQVHDVPKARWYNHVAMLMVGLIILGIVIPGFLSGIGGVFAMFAPWLFLLALVAAFAIAQIRKHPTQSLPMTVFKVVVAVCMTLTVIGVALFGLLLVILSNISSSNAGAGS